MCAPDETEAGEKLGPIPPAHRAAVSARARVGEPVASPSGALPPPSRDGLLSRAPKRNPDDRNRFGRGISCDG